MAADLFLDLSASDASCLLQAGGDGDGGAVMRAWPPFVVLVAGRTVDVDVAGVFRTLVMGTFLRSGSFGEISFRTLVPSGSV